MGRRTPYGQREGNRWVRTISVSRHYWRKYKGFGFHLRFKVVFLDPTLEGCELRDQDTGRVWFISSAKWLEVAQYDREKLQYAIPLEAFTLTNQGLKQTRVERHARKKDRRTDKGNA